MELAPAVGTLGTRDDRRTWLNGRGWDLTWIVGSSVVVPISLILVWAGIPSDLMNLAVTLLVGGPHVFATFLVTYLNPDYRRRHGVALLLVAGGVLTFVVFMTLHHFQALMSFFIFAASFHVLQQNAYLADLYRARGGSRERPASRLLDYAILFLSFYPIASYKLVRGDFMLGDILIVIPSVFKCDATVMTVCALFGVVALLWISKTLLEWRRGALNVPRAILVGATSLIAFLVPAAASGTRLELAFQTVNVWHSIQYLAIVWLVLAAKKRSSGQKLSPFLAAVSGEGRPTALFYATCLVFTSLLMGIIVLLRLTDPLKLSTPQYYYMTVFSVLFIHYAFDGYFFMNSARKARNPEDFPLATLRPAASMNFEGRAQLPAAS